MADETRKCTGCGCTEEKPCPSGCAWVRKDLCSECLPLDENEMPVLADLLAMTSSNLAMLPWRGFLRALDDPKLVDQAAPPRLTPERKALFLKHLRQMADLAAQWKDAVSGMRTEMAALGPGLMVAGPGDLPPEPRILRP